MKIFKKILKNPVFIGNIVHYVSKIIFATLNVKAFVNEKYDINKPYLFAFWHGKQFLCVFVLTKHNTKKSVLVSPSKDGNILGHWLEKVGFEVERGSSRDGNVRSLVKMIKKLKQNYSLGFGIDGPIGPIYKVKPGMTYMAQKCGIPIIPVACEFSSKWIFEKAWDKYEFPKPFSKAVYCIDEPFIVEKDADLEKANLELEKKLINLHNMAKENLK